MESVPKRRWLYPEDRRTERLSNAPFRPFGYNPVELTVAGASGSVISIEAAGVLQAHQEIRTGSSFVNPSIRVLPSFEERHASLTQGIEQYQRRLSDPEDRIFQRLDQDGACQGVAGFRDEK